VSKRLDTNVFSKQPFFESSHKK